MEIMQSVVMYLVGIIVSILKTIDWTQVLTSFINTLMYLTIPFWIELFTGVMGKTSEYLEANKGSSWLLMFMSDVASVMSEQMQKEGKALRDKYDAGELTKEEWDAHCTRLRETAKSKIAFKLQKYPTAYAAKFGDQVEEQMEAWLHNDKRLSKLTKAVENKTQVDPAVLVELQRLIDVQKAMAEKSDLKE